MTDWHQLGFDQAHTPAHRSTDGASSREAALLGGRRGHKARVLRILVQRGALTDEEIAFLTGLGKGSAAKRRLDLQRLDLVDHLRVDGEPHRRRTEAGVQAWVWTVTDAGRSAYDQLFNREDYP